MRLTGEDMLSMPDDIYLSIVIRVRNEAHYLRRVFMALNAQKCDFGVEIIVVDNESADNSRELSLAQGAQVLQVPASAYTPGLALNTGIARARGRLVLLLSAHCLPIGSHFLEDCVAFFDGDEQLAAVRCLSAADREAVMRWFEPRVLQYASREEQAAAEQGLLWTRQYPTAACCVFRKAVWQEIPFNESMESNEDKEWGSRVLGRGWKMLDSAESAYFYMRPLSGWVLWNKQQHQLVELHRFNGYVPLPWKWFLIRVLQAFWQAPGVAFRHIQDAILKNYSLVVVPGLARQPAHKGSRKDFDQVSDVRD